MSTSSSSHHPSRVLPRQLITSKRCLRPARQSLCKPAAKHSGKPRFKHGGPAVCRVPPTANSRTCHHEPSTRPSPACARSSVPNRKQPPIQLKSTVLSLEAVRKLNVLQINVLASEEAARQDGDDGDPDVGDKEIGVAVEHSIEPAIA